MTIRHPQVNLHCHDVGKEYEYLTRVLGFEGEFRVRGPDGQTVFAGAHCAAEGSRLTFVLGDIHEALHGHYDHGEFGRAMEEHPLGTGAVIYLPARNVDALHKELVARGALIDEPPTDQFWGDRTISVTTPSGYYLTFAEPIKGFRFPPAIEARTEWGGDKARREWRAARAANAKTTKTANTKGTKKTKTTKARKRKA